VKNIGKEVKVGVFAAMALVLLYFGFNFLKGADFFSNRKKYYTIYDNADQLVRSNPVYVNGYAVGRVSKISILPEKQNKILVELEIDSDVKLGDSTKAILTSEILSGKYILLSIGRVKEPLKSGDTIRSEVAKGLMDVFTETAEPVADNLQTTLRNFNVVIDNLSSNTRRLDTIFMKLNSTPYLLNRILINTNGRVDELSTSFKSVAENLNVSLSDLKPTLNNFKILSDSLKEIRLNQTLIKTQQTLTNLNGILTQLKKGDNTASKLMTDDTLYVKVNRLLTHMDTLVKHFDNNPKQFLGPLGKSQKKIQRERKREEEARRKAAAAKK
jgi:phospholipid/cholesterol/gamma-HCH transport system substrate-binding protein